MVDIFETVSQRSDPPWTRFIAWRLKHRFLAESQRSQMYSWECHACLGYRPKPGPILKRPRVVLARLVGRVTNNIESYFQDNRRWVEVGVLTRCLGTQERTFFYIYFADPGWDSHGCLYWSVFCLTFFSVGIFLFYLLHVWFFFFTFAFVYKDIFSSGNLVGCFSYLITR